MKHFLIMVWQLYSSQRVHQLVKQIKLNLGHLFYILPCFCKINRFIANLILIYLNIFRIPRCLVLYKYSLMQNLNHFLSPSSILVSRCVTVNYLDVTISPLCKCFRASLIQRWQEIDSNYLNFLTILSLISFLWG